jgi:hypothetical protein
MKICGTDKSGYNLVKRGEQHRLEGSTRKEALMDAVTRDLVAEGQHVRFAYAFNRLGHKTERNNRRRGE